MLALRKLVVVVMASTLLSACGSARRAAVSNMDDQSIKNEMVELSDKKLCRDITRELGDNRYLKFSKAEAERRNLGDCSQAHQLCVEIGYAYKSDEYASCRIKLAQAGNGATDGNSNSTSKALGNALSDWGKKMQDGYYSPKTSPVKNCSSYRVGRTIQTNCY